MKKKAISPVVATALLLVVAVMAVIGFQSWFTTFQSGINSDIEDNSNNVNSNKLSIDTLVGDSLYLNNQGKKNTSISSIKINGIDCEVNQNISGAESVDLSTCLKEFPNQKVKIIVQTDKGIVKKTLYNQKNSIQKKESIASFKVSDNAVGQQTLKVVFQTFNVNMDVNLTVQGDGITRTFKADPFYSQEIVDFGVDLAGKTIIMKTGNDSDLYKVEVKESNLTSFTGSDNWIKIKELSLYKNQLTNFKSSAAWIDLQRLTLSFNNLSSFVGRDEWEDLYILYLHSNNLTKFLGSSKWQDLHILAIGNNPLLVCPNANPSPNEWCKSGSDDCKCIIQ